ncbi:MAG: hypothetical protein KDK62_08650 [Chlamydiia bacterium]|nr:hypothetical protein [Chlamydiia bacterium]
MNSETLNKALEMLGSYLKDKGLEYEVVAIGGGALLMLGLLVRPTKDLDLVALVDNSQLVSAKPLPLPLKDAIENVGLALKLPMDWINTAPADLMAMGLPDGFKSRLEKVRFGGLVLYCASRFDQICFKLYASVDQGPDSKHFDDLKRLKPSTDELKIAAGWCQTHDVSEMFRVSLEAALAHMGAKGE